MLWVTGGSATAAGRPVSPAGARPTGPRVLGFPESWGLSNRDVTDIGAGLLIVVLLVITLVLRIRRRRQTEQVTSATAEVHAFPHTAEAWRGSGVAEEPTGSLPKFEASSVVLPVTQVSAGWHRVRGDPSRLAYWDGSTWSAYRQWDGSHWVDPTKSLT